MTTININGIEMYYEVLGAGEPVLLLHGLGSSSDGWALQRDAFSAKYRVILLDVRGHGRSSKPPGPYSVALFAKDVALFLDKLGSDVESTTAVHIVGLSMGGMIGFQMAVDYPEKVRSLTAVNSSPELVANDFKSRLSIWKRKLLVNIFSMEKIATTIGERLFPDPEQAAYRKMFQDEFAKNDKRSYKAATDALFGWSVRDKIGDIQCPVLVLSGDQDYTAVSVKEAFTAEIPGAKLHVIKDSRHATPIDQSKAFNTAVLNFLRSI